MKRLILPLLLTILMLSCTEEKEQAIRLHIEDKEYEQLIMECVMLGSKKDTIIGIKEGQNTWAFPLSDSIIEHTSYYTFYYAPLKKDDGKSRLGTKHMIALKAMKGTDTVSTYQLPMDKNRLEYDIKYLNHSQGENRSGQALIRCYEFDNFMTSYKEDSEWAIKSEHPYFLFFYDYKERKSIDYEEGLKMYTAAIKKYPNSQELISTLSGFKKNIKTKDELAALLKTFSEEMQQSPFGKSIRQYMDTYLSVTKFENTTLPKWDTEEPEEIIQDKTKNTLIVFSASWCGPCRKQIPLLKEIYSDLKNKLNIVYVSMDQRKTVEGWRKEMTEKEIPWRSVLAADQLDEINKKYFVIGIPHTLLYLADAGTVEVLDVRKEENKAKLYNLE